MSEAFDKGRTFERKVASILRSKLGARVVRDRRSGAGVNKSDISDYYQEIPLHLEIKDQETIKIKEWFRQADAASSFNMAPTVVLHADEEVLAVIRFSDLVNFLVEIADQKAEIDDLHAPQQLPAPTGLGLPDEVPKELQAIDPAKVAKVINQKKATATRLCKNGHIADDYGYCQQLSCKYSRGYRPPKAKRR